MESNALVATTLFTWGPLIVYWIVWLMMGVASAYYVYQDGIKIMPLKLKVHPGWWALFCLVFSVWGLLAYWVMHHSSLALHERDEKL